MNILARKVSGIYEIVNTINGHRYIGSSINIQKRWNEHKRDLNNNKHHSIYLQRAWNKYGANHFEFNIIETCFFFALIFREQHYINTLQPAYNISPTAGSILGIKHTDESRKKMRDSRGGKNNAMYGRQHSDTTRKQISDSKKGTPAWNKGKKGLYSASEETRAKISASQKGRKSWNEGIKTGKPAWNIGLSVGWNKGKKGLQVAWNKGIAMSEEAKKKLSDVHKGKKLSEEHKKKISNSLIGNLRTLGYKHSEEARQKMSVAQKRIQQEKRNANK